MLREVEAMGSGKKSRPKTLSELVDATIIETTEIAQLWRPWFRDRQTWQAWFAFLKALFCLPKSEDERQRFTACTNRTELPGEPIKEAWLICGRRAGKSFMLALIACYLAIFKDWRPYLSPGETGTIKVIAVDRRQARVIFRYCYALLHEVSALAELVRWSDNNETIELVKRRDRGPDRFIPLGARLYDHCRVVR